MTYQPYTKRRILYHFLNGLWSNIPVCCIVYWCRGFHGMYRDFPDPHYREANYVRCNRCATTRRIQKIHANGRIATWLIDQ